MYVQIVYLMEILYFLYILLESIRLPHMLFIVFQCILAIFEQQKRLCLGFSLIYSPFLGLLVWQAAAARRPIANYNKTTITKQFYYILDFLSRAAQQTNSIPWLSPSLVLPAVAWCVCKPSQSGASSPWQRLRLWNLHTDGAKSNRESEMKREKRVSPHIWIMLQ